ncbi:hypothetical protein [Methanomassiliicoccus luminyensis]|uniref:hypothetical protein n=1 Tax=Methanomassiliicoccus luminyensis TaxID=1080712 RepID=UPI0003696D1E|nr:hypothetical protein [Methanomassiliicoccus luminyensis]
MTRNERPQQAARNSAGQENEGWIRVKLGPQTARRLQRYKEERCVDFSHATRVALDDFLTQRGY